MKGKPIRDKIEINIHLIITGLFLKKFPNIRISWIPFIKWMINPAHKNNIDLKIACITKWKNASSNIFNETIIIIIDNCLKVENAIIFLKSVSKNALIPAITIVINDIFNKNIEFLFTLNKKLKRIIKYTPAVTNVEEWTKEDTGVGAAIAAGSQAEKGICALLVIPAKIIKIPNKYSISFRDKKSKVP